MHFWYVQTKVKIDKCKAISECQVYIANKICWKNEKEVHSIWHGQKGPHGKEELQEQKFRSMTVHSMCRLQKYIGITGQKVCLKKEQNTKLRPITKILLPQWNADTTM